MSARNNEAIVRETHEAFNARDLDWAAAYAAEDAEWVTVATGETFPGPEGYKRYMQGWTAAFSEASTEITAVYTPARTSRSSSSAAGAPTAAR
jgi:ketosteroid isomerase-like protein